MKFRIVYWSGSIITEFYVFADDAKSALDRFKEVKGKDKKIVKVEEIV